MSGADAGIRVLVVDDSPTARQLLVSLLTEEPGIEIVGEARDGEEAVKLTKKLGPDLVTMDVVMPKCSGIDAVKEILKINPTAKIAMVSALGQEQLVTEALQAGAADYIVKPF